MPPTEADVQRVRAAYEAFNSRFQQIKTGDLTGFEHFMRDDIVLVSVDGWPVSGRFEGLDGYRQWVDEVYTGTVDNRFGDIEVEVIGDYVVATMMSRGRAEDDPTTLEAPVGVVHELREGLVARAWIYLGHERARQAAIDGFSP